MNSNYLLTSRLHFAATQGAGDFAGIKLNTHLDASAEERFAERRQFAPQPDDTVPRRLLAMSMQRNADVDQLPAGHLAVKQRFHDVFQLVGRVLDHWRLAVRGLRSTNERSTSLGEALASVPNDSGFPSAGFRVVVHGTERELKAGLRDEVYRICREAIVNACRHAGATAIEAEVEYRASGLHIAVRDNGRGIDKDELHWGPDGQWGLKRMRERAEQIGARLRLWSAVERGTEVHLCVPGRDVFEQSWVRTAR